MSPYRRSPGAADGHANPLGATWTGEGVNFAVYAGHAEAVELCIFDVDGRQETGRHFMAGPSEQVWHLFMPGLGPGTQYGYRVHGKYAPRQGHRHNMHKLLIDPYATDLRGRFRWGSPVFGHCAGGPEEWRRDTQDSADFVPRSVVTDHAFDWQDDRRPRTPWTDTFIYELHVKGFTQTHPAVPEHLRGTYLGLAHPEVVGYLVDLGVTAVELLPVHSFLSEGHLAETGLVNYWGYNPISFFSPHRGYAVADPVREFKTMVRALHQAGIEVILDVVYNHTAEGDENGPTLSFRGLDNRTYYYSDPDDRRVALNYTGCGNTLRVEHPHVLRMVMDSLRYWTSVMHVDGFRFDLATVLGRENRAFRRDGKFFAALHQDPVLQGIKLIAEPWDLGPNGYQLGGFPFRWAEWNDRFRDTVRRFWRGDRGTLAGVAERIAGSSDVFRPGGRLPSSSINYVACHDGLTLEDIVTYGQTTGSPEAGAPGDGGHVDVAWNCGAEGPSSDPKVQARRHRAKRNMLATVILSHGVPMLLAGDEAGRTQRGDHNAYCQDNGISWLDWHRGAEDRDLHDFVRRLVRLRRSCGVFRHNAFLDGVEHPELKVKDVSWLSESGHEMTADDWHDPGRGVLGMLLGGTRSTVPAHGPAVLMILNASDGTCRFVLPPPPGAAAWRQALDTAFTSARQPDGAFSSGESYSVRARSMIVLVAGSQAQRGLADPRYG